MLRTKGPKKGELIVKSKRRIEDIQEKYREEKKKKKQDKDAHGTLLVIVLIVFILYFSALYLGIFDSGVLKDLKYLG